jgi:hypothetical protein
MSRTTTPGTGHGTAVWSSEAWREAAVAWVDERLAEAGLARDRAVEVEHPHVRPWATVLKVTTTARPAAGPATVWMKACAPGTAFEVGLYEVLAAVVPDRVLTPIATDVDRGWLLLPDGGAPLGERVSGEARAEGLGAALVRYAELQLALVPHVDALLGAGVADMRPPVVPQRFDEALAATAGTAEAGSAEDRAAHARLAAMRPAVVERCERLAASAIPASLDHNDLHPWNVLGGGATPAGGPVPDDVRFYDWGDGVVAHSFAALLVPLGMVREVVGGVDHPTFRRVRHAYLDVFAGVAPGEDLVATLELACDVAKIARALTWERAVRAARDEGQDVDAEWASAPFETLRTLLDDSYLGAP